MVTKSTDVLIIGAGIAGLMSAFYIDKKKRITIISAEESAASNSSYAQGGVAAVTERMYGTMTHNAQMRHIQDTLTTGHDLCREEVVKRVITQSNCAIETLLNLHVPFSKNADSTFHQALEGGHSERRIWHVADHTGTSITNALHQYISTQETIDTCLHYRLLHLLLDDNGTVSGAECVHTQTNQPLVIKAHTIILATGGASGVYPYASGSRIAYGEGIAAAYNAGCTITNMEFVQFHPTYYLDNNKGFLLSEALRGEGALLLDEHQLPFLDKFGGKELMTREKCAHAIYQQLKTQQGNRVLLDARNIDSALLRNHFPYIYKQCQQVGLDMTTDCIPVTPVAHYTCGGIDVDIHGRSNKENLYAVGEVAYTGLHGANRLASNSLLECLVFAKQVAEAINNTSTRAIHKSNVKIKYNNATNTYNWSQAKCALQQTMWDNVAIVRTQKGLQQAQNHIHEAQEQQAAELGAQAAHYRNMLTTCELIVRSALLRTESRGLHKMTDFPDTHQHTHDTQLTKEF